MGSPEAVGSPYAGNAICNAKCNELGADRLQNATITGLTPPAGRSSIPQYSEKEPA
jgi:hypothetical protein